MFSRVSNSDACFLCGYPLADITNTCPECELSVRWSRIQSPLRSESIQVLASVRTGAWIAAFGAGLFAGLFTIGEAATESVEAPFLRRSLLWIWFAAAAVLWMYGHFKVSIPCHIDAVPSLLSKRRRSRWLCALGVIFPAALFGFVQLLNPSVVGATPSEGARYAEILAVAVALLAATTMVYCCIRYYLVIFQRVPDRKSLIAVRVLLGVACALGVFVIVLGILAAGTTGGFAEPHKVVERSRLGAISLGGVLACGLILVWLMPAVLLRVGQSALAAIRAKSEGGVLRRKAD